MPCCPAGTAECCPPLGGQAGLPPNAVCAQEGDNCCTAAEGGGYCPGWMPKCCPPTPEAPVGGCCLATQSCCATDADCGQGASCQHTCCVAGGAVAAAGVGSGKPGA